MSLYNADDEIPLPSQYAHEDAACCVTGPLPDDSHLDDCNCPECLPELYDAAEQGKVAA